LTKAEPIPRSKYIKKLMAVFAIAHIPNLSIPILWTIYGVRRKLRIYPQKRPAEVKIVFLMIFFEVASGNIVIPLRLEIPHFS
jgi:hypothetical protein